MARQGRAGPALSIAAIGSNIAGTLSVLGLMLLAPLLALLALKFDRPSSRVNSSRGQILQNLEKHAHRQRSVGKVRQWAANIGLAVAVGVVFFLAAQLGLALLTTAERVAVFWPASGVAAGTLIALGPRAPGCLSQQELS
jgi:hypothetical protein